MATPPFSPCAADPMATARAEARRVVHALARDAGAPLITRPLFGDSAEPVTRDVEPLAGTCAARDLELAAGRAARDYIRQAREAGHSWDRIGRDLRLVPGGDADQSGATVAEAAYTYAADPPDAQAPWRPRSFGWTCRSCDQHISDRGLIGGPTDDEHGHARDCPRLARAVAQWAAGWEAEP
jgi:hypothetical protein